MVKQLLAALSEAHGRSEDGMYFHLYTMCMFFLNHDAIMVFEYVHVQKRASLRHGHSFSICAQINTFALWAHHYRTPENKTARDQSST